MLLLCFICLAQTAFADSVEPLLNGWIRHQEAPFNTQCPHWTDKNGKVSEERCIVGCVATALENIISFYGQPIVLQDTLHGWTTDNYVIDDVLPGVSLDTRCILPDYGDGTAASIGISEGDYTEAVEAVAQLSLWCGMAAHMNWGLSSSGANISRLVDPLHKAFGWKTATVIDSYCYTPHQWQEILKNELRHGRPVLYAGYTTQMGGHAFVLDGFDEEGLFHVNWGYGTDYYDNYYDITQLTAFCSSYDTLPDDIPQGFFCNQEALLLHPDLQDLSLLADSVERSGREIVVEDVTVDAAPIASKFTPITITLRNTADVILCTPFDIFTNAPTDTLTFSDGVSAALYGAILQPGEQRTMTVHCLLQKEGNRILRITPDGEHVIFETPIAIEKGTKDALSFTLPNVSFTPSRLGDDDTMDATFRFDVSNTLDERSGSLVTFCLMPGTEIITSEPRHFEHYYLAPRETAEKTISFRHLAPGDQYTLVIRQPWTIQQQLTFTVPLLQNGIAGPAPDAGSTPDDLPRYDLGGRRTRQHGNGIYIQNGQKKLQ